MRVRGRVVGRNKGLTPVEDPGSDPALPGEGVARAAVTHAVALEARPADPGAPVPPVPSSDSDARGAPQAGP